jgi:ATP-binding cassette subfamily A (ABC1) protein 3
MQERSYGYNFTGLDEPTSGVDPAAKRELWGMISALVSNKHNGRLSTCNKTSVILTTHSMDECEALCSRIGIMAHGRLCCLGSAQRLKSKFGKGFQLEMTIKAVEQDDEDFSKFSKILARHKDPSWDWDLEASDPSESISFDLHETQAALSMITGDNYLSRMVTADNIAASFVFKEACSSSGITLRALSSFVALELRMRNLDHYMSSAYPGAVLRERQDMKVRYEVSSEHIVLADVFAGIEENKEYLKLSDYGVSQTSLEQVFNMHAAAHAAAEDESAYHDLKLM